MPTPKPEFVSSAAAIEWCRAKYSEREKDLMGSMPPLEMFLMGLLEIMAAQAKTMEKMIPAIERIAASVERRGR